MKQNKSEDLLILTKTYPSPSSKYRETTCVAAINNSGEMRRLYPIPYRLLHSDRQFQRWSWIRANLSERQLDHRPESRSIDVDTIQTLGHIGTKLNWSERMQWVEPQVSPSFSLLETRRQTTGETLGFIHPSKILELEIKPLPQPDWTEEEKLKLVQDGLFDNDWVRNRPLLRKVPFQFRYHYEIETSDGIESNQHTITDWEIGMLYWNCVKKYGDQWEDAFRNKLIREFSKKYLIFLMGTIHKFPDKWLIVGIIYPPKVQARQDSLWS
jgi:hypothetical protein